MNVIAEISKHGVLTVNPNVEKHLINSDIISIFMYNSELNRYYTQYTPLDVQDRSLTEVTLKAIIDFTDANRDEIILFNSCDKYTHSGIGCSWCVYKGKLFRMEENVTSRALREAAMTASNYRGVIKAAAIERAQFMLAMATVGLTLVEHVSPIPAPGSVVKQAIALYQQTNSLGTVNPAINPYMQGL